MATRRLEILITGNSRDAERAMDRVEGRAGKMGSKLAKVGAAVGGAFAAAGAISVFGSMIDEAREAAKIGRLTDAVIKSTGGAAKVTAGQVSDLAEALSKKAGVDDEVIQSGSNLLLTFTKVRDEVGKGNDIFTQATTLALDMSAALGTDMSAASMQLGKALNDPIKGLSTLGRAGVSFTEQQKEQVKALVGTGDVLGAQKIILSELETQFGGAAEAAADPIQKLGVMWGNFLEGVGAKVLPWVEDISTGIGERMPAMMERASAFVEDLSSKVVDLAKSGWNLIEPAVMDVWGAVKNLVTIGGQLWETYKPVVEGMLFLGGAAVIGGIIGLAAGFEAVTGWLAKTDGAIDGIVVGLAGLAVAQAWPLIVSAIETLYLKWLYLQGAITSSVILNGLGQIAGGFVAMGTSASAGAGMVKAGMSSVIGAINPATAIIGSLAAAYAGSVWWTTRQREEHEKLRNVDIGPSIERMASGMAAGGELAKAYGADLSGLSDALVTAQSDAEGLAGWVEDVSKKGFFGGAGLFSRWLGGADKIDAAKEDLDKLTESIESLMANDLVGAAMAWEQFGDSLSTADLERLAEEMGTSGEALVAFSEDFERSFATVRESSNLSRREFADLARELDLSEAEMNTGRGVFLIRRHLKGLAEEAGYTGPAIQEAMNLPPEVLEEQTAAWEELSGAVSGSWSNALDAVAGLGSMEHLTGDSISGWYEMQRVNAENFASNITEAFRLGYDPGLISRLLQAGPAEAAPIVQGLLDNHSASLLWTVNAGERAMAELNEKAVAMANLTHKATVAESTAMTADLGEAMAIQNLIAEVGAGATVQAIASQLQMGVGEVARIAGEYGIEVQGGTDVMRYVAAAGAGQTVEALASELGIGVDKVRYIAASYGVQLAGAINPILHSVGKNGVSFGQGAVLRNAGGPIPGPNVNKDVIPAMLTPGEFVLNKEASKQLGMGALNFMNRTGRLPGYNSGGEVLLAAGRMLQGAGARVSEHPMFGGVGGGHAPGGYHYRNTSGTGGDAFDANKGAGTSSSEMAFFDQWAPKIAAMGLRVLWRVAGHFNHLHADLGKGGYGMGGSGNFAHFAPLPKPPSIGGWPLAQGGEGMMNLAYMAASELANSSYGASMGPGGSNSAVRSMVQQMAAQRGWIGTEWSALDRLVQKESSWNPTAQNPTSTAFGLFQFLNSTWGPYGPKTSNPALQAKYGFQYISDRYGSPSAALAFHLRNNWYNDGGEVTAHGNSFDSGGVLARGYNLVRNDTGRPEHLVPAGRGQTIVNVYVEGSVVSERDLVDVVADGLNRKQRNSPTPVLPGVSG